MNLFDLSGKVALVTGASSGLGRDAALAYAEYGAKVALLARRLEKLEEVSAEIKKRGSQALPVACDVTDEDQIWIAVQKAVDKFGKIDILLNNAGTAVRGAVHEMELDDWNRVLDTNLSSLFLVSKYVLPHMIKQKYGKVVNIASINAIIADKAPELARHAYNATKAGVRGLTMGMAATYGVHNITVNSIGPGLFMSEMTEKGLFKHQAFLDYYNNSTPMGRPGKQGELNGTIIYLSSDASSYVNSQHIIVDGGFSVV